VSFAFQLYLYRALLLSCKIYSKFLGIKALAFTLYGSVTVRIVFWFTPV